VPDTVFSSRVLDLFLNDVKAQTSDAERRAVFDTKIASLDDGSVRRYDFLHKLCLQLSDLPVEVSRPLALAISAKAEESWATIFW